MVDVYSLIKPHSTYRSHLRYAQLLNVTTDNNAGPAKMINFKVFLSKRSSFSISLALKRPRCLISYLCCCFCRNQDKDDRSFERNTPHICITPGNKWVKKMVVETLLKDLKLLGCKYMTGLLYPGNFNSCPIVTWRGPSLASACNTTTNMWLLKVFTSTQTNV